MKSPQTGRLFVCGLGAVTLAGRLVPLLRASHAALVLSPTIHTNRPRCRSRLEDGGNTLLNSNRRLLHLFLDFFEWPKLVLENDPDYVIHRILFECTGPGNHEEGAELARLDLRLWRRHKEDRLLAHHPFGLILPLISMTSVA